MYSSYLEVSGFDQTFFEKACFAPLDHAKHVVFAQAFFEKACG